MATLNPIPNQSIPFGQTAEIDLGFTTQPAKTYNVTVTNDGQQVGAGQVTFNAEPTPAVSAGSTGHGWEIQVSGGTLTALGANKFSLAA